MNKNIKTCYFKIKPSDTSFFRNGHAFEKQLNNHIESLNIPYPSVFYGAIFSALLRQGNNIGGILKDIKYKNVNNIEKKLKGNFMIDSIYIYDEIKNEVYIKAPLDLFENDYEIDFGIYKDKFLYSPQDNNGKYERCEDKFISLNDLLDYYSKGNMNDKTLYSIDYFFSKYKKIGIEIEKQNRTAKDKHLYRLDMVEFSDKRFSYLLKCKTSLSNNEIKDDVIKLGGEGKLATLTHTFKSVEIIDQLNEFYNNKVIYDDKIKVILTTPMIINNFNDFIEENNIKCAVTGKAEYIGGFDMASGKQKIIRKAIPAGSILIIEDANFKNKKIIEIFQNEKISKLVGIKNSKERHRGFGSIIILPFNDRRNN